MATVKKEESRTKPISKLQQLLDTSNKTRGKKSKKSESKTVERFIHTQFDPNCIYKFSQKVVRVQYPGIVKDLRNALETLGGLHGIESAIAEPRKRLELSFHPDNKYNKPCIADKDFGPGILIKVKVMHSEDEASCSKDCESSRNKQYDYEVIGFTAINFTFNKLCDYQYLPLHSENPETKESKVEYLYNKIMPDHIPDMKWFTGKSSAEQPYFFLPANFSRSDAPCNELYLKTGEKYQTFLRPEISENFAQFAKEKRERPYLKRLTIFVNFHEKVDQVPDKPPDNILKLVKEKQLEDKYKMVKKMFDKRPVWSKVAIQYYADIKLDQTKVILPAVSYFCNVGPWRMAWIRYGYNPQKEYEARIYQTLDYRIREAEGTKLKVTAKRNYAAKNASYLGPNTVKKVSLKDEIPTGKRYNLEERSFTLRPNVTPPARQMFYQYCDILLPEIQEMMSRLPKQPLGVQCDLKNGWLPANFTEQCREKVNQHILAVVQSELLEDKKRLIEKQSRQLEDDTKERLPTYCSKMLHNIKKGIYRSSTLPIAQEASTSYSDETEASNSSVIDTVDLLEENSDEEMDITENVNDVISRSLPETIEHDSEEEECYSQATDLDIDMDAVEEINQMIAGMNQSSSQKK